MPSFQNSGLLTFAYSWSRGKVLFFTNQVECKVILSSAKLSKLTSFNKRRLHGKRTLVQPILPGGKNACNKR